MRATNYRLTTTTTVRPRRQNVGRIPKEGLNPPNDTTFERWLTTIITSFLLLTTTIPARLISVLRPKTTMTPNGNGTWRLTPQATQVDHPAKAEKNNHKNNYPKTNTHIRPLRHRGNSERNVWEWAHTNTPSTPSSPTWIPSPGHQSSNCQRKYRNSTKTSPSAFFHWGKSVRRDIHDLAYNEWNPNSNVLLQKILWPWTLQTALYDS